MAGTWDVPDATFDSKNNIWYACTRLSPPDGDELGIIGYDRTGKVVVKAPLDPGMKPDNLGAPHFGKCMPRPRHLRAQPLLLGVSLSSCHPLPHQTRRAG